MALEDIVNQFNQGGLGATWSAGQKYAADRGRTLAETAQTQANTDRTTQMTPSVVANSQNQAEASRLGNLNPQAEEKQGLPGTNAQIKAQQAQQVLKNIPQDVLKKAQDDTRKASTENLGIMIDTMESGGDMQQALTRARQHLQSAGANLPQDQLQQELTKFDQASQQALQQYGKDPSKWLGELKNHRYSIAGSQSLGDPAQQGKMTLEDMQQTGATERSKIAADAAVTSATTKAAATTGGAGKVTAASLTDKWIETFRSAPEGSPKKEEARVILNGLLHGSTQVKEGQFGLPPTKQTKEALPASGSAPSPVKGWVKGADGVMHKQ